MWFCLLTDITPFIWPWKVRDAYVWSIFCGLFQNWRVWFVDRFLGGSAMSRNPIIDFADYGSSFDQIRLNLFLSVQQEFVVGSDISVVFEQRPAGMGFWYRVLSHPGCKVLANAWASLPGEWHIERWIRRRNVFRHDVWLSCSNILSERTDIWRCYSTFRPRYWAILGALEWVDIAKLYLRKSWWNYIV